MQTKSYLPIYLYGSITILEGIFMLFARDTSFNLVVITTAIALIFGAILAFIASLSRNRRPIQFAYHRMHAFAMFIYGVSILIFCDSVEKFTSITAFLFVFYSFSEIIFCAWLYNLKQRIIFQIILVRFLLAIAIGIGTVAALFFHASTFEGFGAIFIMIGLNIILYVPIMHRNGANEIDLAPE